jgi:hypothetical protein
MIEKIKAFFRCEMPLSEEERQKIADEWCEKRFKWHVDQYLKGYKSLNDLWEFFLCFSRESKYDGSCFTRPAEINFSHCWKWWYQNITLPFRSAIMAFEMFKEMEYDKLIERYKKGLLSYFQVITYINQDWHTFNEFYIDDLIIILWNELWPIRKKRFKEYDEILNLHKFPLNFC